MNKRKKLFPSSNVATTIEMLIKCSLEEEAYQIYLNLEEKYNLKLDIRILNSIIGYLIKSRVRGNMKRKIKKKSCG